MSFLKTEEFEHNGHKVMLSELSALQRLEYLEYCGKVLKAIPDDADDNDKMVLMTSMDLRAGSRLVGQSLWQRDINGPSVDELQQQVLSTWPVTAIGGAAYKVKELSLMLPPVQDAAAEDTVEDFEAVTPEKSTPAS